MTGSLHEVRMKDAGGVVITGHLGRRGPVQTAAAMVGHSTILISFNYSTLSEGLSSVSTIVSFKG